VLKVEKVNMSSKEDQIVTKSSDDKSKPSNDSEVGLPKVVMVPVGDFVAAEGAADGPWNWKSPAKGTGGQGNSSAWKYRKQQGQMEDTESNPVISDGTTKTNVLDNPRSDVGFGQNLLVTSDNQMMGPSDKTRHLCLMEGKTTG
jgi:hypothetical protein